VLCCDPEGRVLLLRTAWKGRSGEPREAWLLPGGGLEPGEDAEAGARRELFEETGLQVGALVAVDQRVVTYRRAGQLLDQHETYFLAETTSTAVHGRGRTEEELEVVLEARFWEIAALEASGERYFPADLAALLSR